MNCTEEEAAEKQCCGPTTMNNNQTRHGIKRPGSEIWIYYSCIGGACMAWEWTDDDKAKKRKGRCGLVTP